jgi:hypothetical protein
MIHPTRRVGPILLREPIPVRVSIPGVGPIPVEAPILAWALVLVVTLRQGPILAKEQLLLSGLTVLEAILVTAPVLGSS